MAVHWQPKGYSIVIPCLGVKDAAGLMDFICDVMNGETVDRVETDGVLRHGEVRIGDCMIMLSEASDNWPSLPASIHVYVPDCDATYKAALEAGATSVREPADQFYGDRSGGVNDKWGNTWWFGTHIENVSAEEIKRRAAELFGQ
jgi:PhnB protein